MLMNFKFTLNYKLKKHELHTMIHSLFFLIDVKTFKGFLLIKNTIQVLNIKADPERIRPNFGHYQGVTLNEIKKPVEFKDYRVK